MLTIDDDAQHRAETLLASTLPSRPGCALTPTGCPPTGALVSVEAGGIEAMAGGLPFSESQFDLVWQSRRDAGQAWPGGAPPVDTVSPLDVAEAWSDGPVHLIDRIVDAAGNVVYERPSPARTSTARSGSAAETTARDAWKVSATSRRTIVVWIGHLDGRSGLDVLPDAGVAAQELVRRFVAGAAFTPPRR